MTWRIFLLMLAGAVAVGLIGFIGGFYGPLILAPEANQGPLLGIFITGPLGMIVGAALGAAIGIRHESKRKAKSHDQWNTRGHS